MSRQPSSRLRSPSPTATKQPQLLQPLRKQWGGIFRPLGRSPAKGRVKERSVQATAPTRNLDLAASASLTPPGLRSRGFHIFVDPPSPTGESKRSDGGKWPPKNIQPPNTPRDSRTIQVWNHDGETGHPEHNLLPQTVPKQSLYAWIPAEACSIEHIQQNTVVISQ